MTKTYARIYQPAKSATQSGRAKTHHWKLEYARPTTRMPDALMGWNSAGDTLTQVHLFFETKHEAIAYATAKQIPYRVSEPHNAAIPPKAYAENFSYTRRAAFDSDLA